MDAIDHMHIREKSEARAAFHGSKEEQGVVHDARGRAQLVQRVGPERGEGEQAARPQHAAHLGEQRIRVGDPITKLTPA